MLVSINSKQADRLSNFFFDVAKGIVLGTFGLSITASGISLFTLILNIFAGVFMVYLCVRVGMFLLNEND
jgi:hypothetical protein